MLELASPSTIEAIDRPFVPPNDIHRRAANHAEHTRFQIFNNVERDHHTNRKDLSPKQGEKRRGESLPSPKRNPLPRPKRSPHRRG